jgi:hypothetical protein
MRVSPAAIEHRLYVDGEMPSTAAIDCSRRSTARIAVMGRAAIRRSFIQ